MTLIALLFTVSEAQANDTLRTSLDDIVAKAMLHSKQIGLSYLQLKQRKIAVRQQKTALLPDISLRGSASYATNMPIYEHGIFNKPAQHEVIHYLFDTGADFYLNLYNGHRDIMQIEAKKLEQAMAAIDWQATTAMIKLDVCNLYLDLERSYMDKNLMETDIRDQKEQLKEIQDLYVSGVVLHSDVLRIELELSKRELLLVEIAHDIEAINQKLKFLTAVNATIIPVDTVFSLQIEPYDDAWLTAKAHAFPLLKSEEEVKLKSLAIKQAKANYLPELGFTGTFTFANPQIFLYPYNDSWYHLGIVGLKLKVPLSAIYKNKHVVREAQVSLAHQELKHHQEEEEMQNNMLKAFLDYKLALVQQEVCLKNVNLAKENARIIKNRYFKSSALVTDLLDADMQCLKSLFELESAKIAIQKNYYFIQFLKGTI